MFGFEHLKRGLILLFLLFVLAACEQQQKPVERQYPLQYSAAIMGTSFMVKVPALPKKIPSDDLKLQIKSLLDGLNSQLSTYIRESELSLFNNSASTQWYPVSKSLYVVLEEAMLISKASKGAFDITVGPLVNLWGFGPDPMSFIAPEKQKIDDQLSKTGYHYLSLSQEKQQVRKEIPELYLDLSAIAKGYAVDQVGLLLEKHGIEDYMVEIGGELRLKGHNINHRPWRIAVEKPTANQRMIQKVLPLSNISLATSGDYRNFFESEGVRFSHTIDPRTGKPIAHKLASVTILSDTTMKADAWATAMMVLGAEQGLLLAEQKKIAALFIVKTEGGFKERASSEFIKILR